VLDRGAGIALIISWFAVLFKGVFPESLYEFETDSIRVSLSANYYLVGLSDTYPSFSISLHRHQTVKVLLIIAGAFLIASGWHSDRSTNYQKTYMHNNAPYNYQQNRPPLPMQRPPMNQTY